MNLPHFNINLYLCSNIPGFANWHTENSFRSIRFIKAAAFLICSSVAQGAAIFESEWSCVAIVFVREGNTHKTQINLTYVLPFQRLWYHQNMVDISCAFLEAQPDHQLLLFPPVHYKEDKRVTIHTYSKLFATNNKQKLMLLNISYETPYLTESKPCTVKDTKVKTTSPSTHTNMKNNQRICCFMQTNATA